MQAKHLDLGQTFTCSALPEKMVCLRVSQTSVQYETYSHKKDYCALGTPVTIDESKALKKIERGADGSLYFVSDKKSKDAEPSESPETIEETETRHRGRKRQEIVFPQGPFTIPELAAELETSTTNIYLRVVAGLKANPPTFAVVDEKRKEGARGRATKIYQAI